MLKRSFVLFLLLSFFFSGVNDKQSQNLAYNNLMLAFYDSLMQDIAYFDAEAIDTRNRTKAVNWEGYKDYYRTKIKACRDQACIEKVMQLVAEGFVNLHSNFNLIASEKSILSQDSVLQTDRVVVFEYPDIRFFDLTSSKEITHLNKTPIKKVFEQFNNLECPYNNSIGCAQYFTNKINRGLIEVDNTAVKTITLSDKSRLAVNFIKQKRIPPTDARKRYQDSLQGWELISKGNKFLLLKNANTLVLKFTNFGYGVFDSDIHCTSPAEENTLCHDVQLLEKSITDLGNIDNLVIDVQNNWGGSEITPLLAVLVKRPFYDLSVRFKKLPSIENDRIRPYSFWFSPRLENWFSIIKKSEVYKQVEYGDFFASMRRFLSWLL